MNDTTYNGYPSWAQWNVSLWVNNDESLYSMARSMSKDDFVRELPQIMPKTPDGAKVSKTAAARAWSCANE
jgi:hypothetical protein